MNELERHPLSAIWGDMPEDQFEELVESIRNSPGQPTVRYVFEDGRQMVLDGWHRYKAAKAARKKCLLVEYRGDDPVGLVIRENAVRRHLTPGQRAACVVACRDWRRRGMQPGQERDPETGQFTKPEKFPVRGGDDLSHSPQPETPIVAPEDSPQDALPARAEEMAAEAGVSERTIRDAQVGHEAGFGEAMRTRQISPHAAAKQARQTQQAASSEPPPPRPPSRTERLEAQRDSLAAEKEELERAVEVLMEAVIVLHDQLVGADIPLDDPLEVVTLALKWAESGGMGVVQGEADDETYPRWYALLIGLKGFFWSLADARSWLRESGITQAQAEQAADALRSSTRRYKDTAAAFRNYARNQKKWDQEREGRDKKGPVWSQGTADERAERYRRQAQQEEADENYS